MNTLKVELENCYGIKRLQATFDFAKAKAYAIYAPNGAMKSSLAQTFKDIVDAKASKDRIFPSRKCVRNITDESNVELTKDSIFVICPYDEAIGHTEKTSTLLVDSKLRKEYEELHTDIDNAKELFLKALKKQSGSKKDLEKEISSTFTRADNDFYTAILRVKDEVRAQSNAPFESIAYDTIFDDKVLAFLGTKDVKSAIESYIKKYNELLASSTYFKKGTFNYYNASTIAKSLADNGFFNAKHTVNLNANEKLEISSQKQLEELIAKEKESISNDAELRKKFSEIDKLITKNANVREFESYLIEHEELLTEFVNIESFREKIWKSYFKAQAELYDDLVDKYQKAEIRKKEIEQEASKQRTQWENVIDVFNSRFFVPFKLSAKNRIPVMLGQEPMLSLAFTFTDDGGQASVEKSALMESLSTGEKRAFYVLNIIFEVEARKVAKQETIFVIDDIADSFDYKNKYAIIQYLKDISEESYFYQIILTHNFDFFRTINSRFVGYPQCLMATRSNNGITLEQATGINNIFINDWKKKFFTNTKKTIASIPFIRNIVEFTKGESDPDFIKLTSLLHWKSDSQNISVADLDAIFTGIFNIKGTSANGKNAVIDTIEAEAASCMKNACTGINLENKIVLSIAIRIASEKFMARKINDTAFADSITANQTTVLLKKYRELFPSDIGTIETLQRVILMTPENIHLNSFMYWSCPC